MNARVLKLDLAILANLNGDCAMARTRTTEPLYSDGQFHDRRTWHSWWYENQKFVEERSGIDRNLVQSAFQGGADSSLGLKAVVSWLSDELDRLRKLEARPGSAPARRKLAASRTKIADLTIYLARRSISNDKSDPLITLLEALLDVDRHRAAYASQPRHRKEFRRAIRAEVYAIKREENITVRALAKIAGVSLGTMSNWRSSPEYLDELAIAMFPW